MSGTEPPPPPGRTPPPPPGGYGAPPTGPGWNVGDTLSYGWTKFQANFGQLLLAAGVAFVALLAVLAVGAGLRALLLEEPTLEYDAQGMVSIDEGSGVLLRLLVGALVAALVVLVMQVVLAGMIRGALAVTEGRRFEVAVMWRTDRIVSVVLTSAIVAAATFVGFALCYLPGLVVGLATSYSLYFVLDRGLEPVAAVRASVLLVREHLADALVWYLVGGIVAGAGALFCGVGLVVTVPVVIIGTACTYRSFTGQPVAA